MSDVVLINFFLYPSHLYQANIIRYSMWIILRNDCEKSKQAIGKNYKMLGTEMKEARINKVTHPFSEEYLCLWDIKQV